MIVKNMKKYFTFEIQILDDKDMHRRFRVSNFQSTTKVRPFCTTMPIGLSTGWNQIQFNLADFTRRAYGSTYMETTRVQVHANVRIRRIYFSDRLYCEEEMPTEYRLFVPSKSSKEMPKKASADKGKTAGKDEVTPLQLDDQPIPSGAPPTPAEPAEPSPESAAAPAEGDQPAAAAAEGDESPDEGGEGAGGDQGAEAGGGESPSGGETTDEGGATDASEIPTESEAPPEGEDAPAEGGEAPAEAAEAPAEEPTE